MSHSKKRPRPSLLAFEPPATLLTDILPLHLSSLHASVRRALADGSTALKALRAALASEALDAPLAAAERAADAARESTFAFLEDPSTADQHSAAYAVASLWCAEAALNGPSESEAAQKALRACDLAILRGGVEDWAALAAPIIAAAERLSATPDIGSSACTAAGDDAKAAGAGTGARLQLEEATVQHVQTPLARSLPRLDARALSVEAFRDTYMLADPPVPVIITGAMEGWPAMGARRWDLGYLKQKAGGRLVPVETCSEADSTRGYMSESWERRVMSLADYIDNFIAPRSAEDGSDDAEEQDERGYLAQYQLFDQIPSLREDIATPRYCAASTPEDARAPADCEQRAGSDPLVSAWLGPAGSVSPLHNDPFHNLLAQVVGHKYVRLYDAQHTPRLYPRSGPQCNNSHVDLDHPEPQKHPLFHGAPFYQCILSPGEMLYMPRHAWHYVRSLETSFSVSFWWGAKMGLRNRADGAVEAFF
eukprot:3164119-Prymnesium_polylepis.1